MTTAAKGISAARRRVTVAGQLAAVDPGADEGTDFFAAFLEHLVLVATAELGELVTCSVEAAQDAAVAFVLEALDQHGQRGDESVSHRAVGGDVDGLLLGGERVEEQVLLARPAPVDRVFAGPSALGDRVDADRGRTAAVGEEVKRSRQDGLLGGLTARPSAPRRLPAFMPSTWGSTGTVISGLDQHAV